jgi:undecaprenyl pyrophosphate phosphatase UppP
LRRLSAVDWLLVAVAMIASFVSFFFKLSWAFQILKRDDLLLFSMNSIDLSF